jgi:hypothetical protein
MAERRAESIEDGIWFEFECQIKALETLARDPWLRPELRTALQVLADDVDKAYGKFERSMRVGCPNDGGPTAADIAGEVQHG